MGAHSCLATAGIEARWQPPAMGNAHAAGMDARDPARTQQQASDQRPPNADGRTGAPRLRAHACSPGAAVMRRSPELEGRREKRLDLSGRRGDALPAAFVADADVTEVLLGENGLRELPGDVAARWPRLQRLGAGGNAIARVAPGLGRLADTLVWLDMTHNALAGLPDDFGQLRRLQSLGVSDCRLAEFPASLTRLAGLRKLGLFNNLLRSLPPQIGDMAGLCKLDLSGNQLASLPDEIGRLTGLTWLNLTNNRLAALPASMSSLVRLRELGLADNELEDLPDLSGCASLSLLTLFNNKLRALPAWTAALPALARLDASGNEIAALPPGLLSAPALELLNVRGNRIAAIDASGANPQALSSLDVRDNALDVLPAAVLGPALCVLRGDGNPLRLRDAARKRAVVCPGGAAAPPTLLEAAGALLVGAAAADPGLLSGVGHRLPPSLRTLAAEGARPSGRAKTCGDCARPFLHAGLVALEARTVSDADDVPFGADACSLRCAAAIGTHRPDTTRGDGEAVAAAYGDALRGAAGRAFVPFGASRLCAAAAPAALEAPSLSPQRSFSAGLRGHALCQRAV